MYSPFQISITTPQRNFFEGDVEAVIFDSPDGEVCILKNHASMVAALSVGRIRFLRDAEWTEAVNSEGYVEVRPGEALIFAQTVELPEEIDINKALEKKELLEEKLRQAKSMSEYRQGKLELAKALARLSMGERGRRIE